MNDLGFKFNFATVLSILVVIVNSYFAFMGMIWSGMNMSKATAIVIIVGLLTIALIYLMCLGKTSRWNRGRIAEVLSAIFILVIGFYAMRPIGNVFNVAKDGDKIIAEIGSLYQDVDSLNKAYESYTKSRIASYRQTLELAVAGKSINPSDYNNFVAGAGGNSDSDKINSLVNSLESQLFPKQLQETLSKRNEWLQGVSNMSVWNIKFPSNIKTLSSEIEAWDEEYTTLSDKFNPGENFPRFEMQPVASNISNRLAPYQEYPNPSLWLIMMMLISIAILLLPYYITRRPLASHTSH